MRAEFKVGANPSNSQLARAMEEFSRELRQGEAKGDLGRRTIGMTTTRIAHGWTGVPRWRAYNPEGPGVIYQSQAPDREFLYLIATSSVTAGIEVW